jgi:hypothetical protein
VDLDTRSDALTNRFASQASAGSDDRDVIRNQGADVPLPGIIRGGSPASISPNERPVPAGDFSFGRNAIDLGHEDGD